jgi:hypothetical protein
MDKKWKIIVFGIVQQKVMTAAAIITLLVDYSAKVKAV